MKLIGPFSQIITMNHLPIKGALNDSQLEIIENGGVLINEDKIVKIGSFDQLIEENNSSVVRYIKNPMVLLPGFVDCHTHTCFGGSRAKDFAMRIAGKSYLEIANEGGGIWNTVEQTRQTPTNDLIQLTTERIHKFIQLGITTLEIKSGYGLSLEEEIRLLQIIQSVKEKSPIQILSTCLGAHTLPKDFKGNHKEYLQYLLTELLPKISTLTNRIDIFTEKSAFSIEDSTWYLQQAKKLGFDITVHADQFTAGSAKMAIELQALSADHLEALTDQDIELFGKSDTVAVALPGASLGIGDPFTPARKLLDAGACLAIASDYNPGSAPMGNLLTQASILACYEKLSTTEVFAALTFRAAKALKIEHIGKLIPNYIANMQAYPTNDYRDILYHQGQLTPSCVWSNGQLIHSNTYKNVYTSE